MSLLTRRFGFWTALVCVLILGLLFSFWPRAVLVDLVELNKKEFLLTVDEEGKTRIRDVFSLSAPVAGHVLRIDAEVGDEVIANETVLARIEPSDPSFLDVRSQAEAEANVQAAKSAQKSAAAILVQAQAEMEFADTDVKRSRELIVENTISQRALDEAERAYKTRRAAVTTAQAILQERVFELERAKAQLMAPAGGHSEHSVCECVPILAPVSGRILRILHESEGVVAAGHMLLEIGDPTDLEIAIELLSADAVKVSPGHRVIIEGWGGSNALEGRVRHVEPFGFTKVSALGIEEQRVNVIVDLVSPKNLWAKLGHGYQLDARIVLWESPEVISLPLTALFRNGKGWAVFAYDDGRARLTSVELERHNGLQAQVAGINEGEYVVAHPSDRVFDGAKIAGR